MFIANPEKSPNYFVGLLYAEIYVVERILSGSKEFDKLVYGGFPEKAIILLFDV